MKLAYSIVLGESVLATEVEHADTTAFQIVCPCCSESVFKVVRRLDGDQTSHFFSHRQASPEHAAQCEIRVASFDRQATELRNSEARGQSLVLFQEYIRKALSLERWCYGRKHPEVVHRELARLPGNVHLVSGIRTDQIRFGLDDIVEDEMPWARGCLIGHGISIATTFAERVQERISTDMLRHLMTEEGKSNHLWLIRHSAIRLHEIHELGLRMMRRGQVRLVGRPPAEKTALAMAFTSNPKKLRALAAETDRRFEGQEGDELYEMITGCCCIDLLRLPYAEMLANHRAGRPVMEGLEPRTEPDELSVVLRHEEPEEEIRLDGQRKLLSGEAL